MTHLLKSLAPQHYPVLHLEFTDGFSGDLDFTETTACGNMFAPLKDRNFFGNVRLGADGYSFGWRLDDLGNELDFSAEGARIDLEMALVRKSALDYSAKIEAAE